MHRLTRIILSALLLCSFSLTSALPALAASTRLVSTTGSDSGDCTASPCATIAYAYTQSVTGDTISVAAGTYTETSGYDITKTITISGAGASSTIVQAAASAGIATHRFYKVNASGITVTIQNLTLRYGVEASGGALNVATGTLNLTNVILSDNQVNNSLATGLNGGALSVNGGTANISNSAIINNSVTSNDITSSVRGSGGAIFLGSTGTITLNNTTVSGNTSSRGGGGVFTNGGTLNLNYSTIANNTSNTAEGVAYTSLDGGGINRNGGALNLNSSIVAGNKKGISSPSDNDCAGTISSQGYNLTGSSTGCSLAGTGDVTVSPASVFSSVLGPLADNGGATSTHALIVGGAAINAIPNGTNSCGSGTFTADQRGGTRPYNSACDMGAYELKTIQSVSTTGTDSGDCTITDCLTIAYAYSKSQAGNTISVAAGTYTETSGYDITKTITISGAGASSTIVQAAASAGIATHRFYKVNASGITVTIQNLTLRYGVEASGGALNVATGTLNLTNVTLSDNQVNNSLATGLNGGALSVNGGTANISNSAIINNSVTSNDITSSVRGSGGAIFLGSTGTITLNNTTVSGNTSSRGGGGVFTNGGTLNLNYSTIANNTSNTAEGVAYTSLDGGGINRNGGALNLNSSIVAGNKKGISSPSDNDCAGTISSQGYNLTGSSTGCSLSGTGDVTVSPATVFTNVLGPLANNGGATSTHMLYGGNAAVDAIPNGTNSCGSGSFAADQRGNTRPFNTNCDMGAYESQDAQPTVSMSSTASNPTNTAPIPVTVTFSESVTGFVAGDITAGNATINNFAGSGASYTFDLTPASAGTVTADIAAGVAQDAGNNPNSAATQFSRTYDATAPLVTAFAATSPTNSLNISITAFTAADANGVTAYLISESATPPSAGAAGWAASGPTTYAVASSGSYTLYPWAKDAAGNVSAVYSAPASVNVDTTAPTVTSFSATSPSNSLNIPITAFTAADASGIIGYLITESATPPSAGAAGWAASAPATYTVASDGSYTLYPWAKDAAGNVSAVYGAPASAAVETSAPSIVSSARVTTSPTNAASVSFLVTFSEAVSGVDTSDFSLTTSGITGVVITGVSGIGATRTVSINTGSGSGNLRLDVPLTATITDLPGNPLANTPYTSGEAYTIDTVVPTAGGLLAPNVTVGAGATYTFTVTFSDNLAIDSATLDGSDIRITGPGGFDQLATLVSVTPSGNGTSRTATYQITAPGGAWDVADNGTYVLAIQANQVFDTAGNPLGATSLGSFLVSVSNTVYLPLVQR